jgi:hypothetical protein
LENKTRVIVYGSSLNMAGVSVSLKADSHLEAMWVDPHSPNCRQYLYEFNPAAIVYDLNDPPPDVDIKLLREQPGVLLIGVAPDSNDMLILSSRSQQALSISDLVSTIRRQDANELSREGTIHQEVKP